MRPCDFSNFSSKRLIDSWCAHSKSVNQISDHAFKCFSVSLISSVKSECVAKFRFASVFCFTLLFAKIRNLSKDVIATHSVPFSGSCYIFVVMRCRKFDNMTCGFRPLVLNFSSKVKLFNFENCMNVGRARWKHTIARFRFYKL